MKRNQTILFHCTDTTLYQLISCYLNLCGYRVVASMKAKDVLQKIDRQKFSALLMASDSEVVLDQILYATSLKEGLNRNSPLVLINDAAQKLQVEEKFVSLIKGIVEIPFTLDGLHKSLLVAMASTKK